MKTSLFLILLLSAGLVAAGDDYGFGPHESSMTETLDLVKMTQENICRSGWEESNFLVLVQSTEPAKPDGDFLFYHKKIDDDGLVNLEICPDNGLLRVRPEKKPK